MVMNLISILLLLLLLSIIVCHTGTVLHDALLLPLMHANIIWLYWQLAIVELAIRFVLSIGASRSIRSIIRIGQAHIVQHVNSTIVIGITITDRR
jgi:hypothetical protein